MESAAPTLVEIAGASKRVARRALDIGSNRLELLIVELQEERERLLLAFLLSLGAFALALLAGFAFTLAIMVLLWDRSPVTALVVLTVVYGVGALMLYFRAMQLKHSCDMFASTLDQLRKDRECLTESLQ